MVQTFEPPPDTWAPDGAYAWDLWLLPSGDGVHLYHLRAPRSLPPGQRHFHACVGHAWSTDLIHWEDRGPILTPGRGWDRRAIWTGSVLPHAGRLWFAYTGLGKASFFRQQIAVGMAPGPDGPFKNVDSPGILPDPRWYPRGLVQDWRDPFLFLDGDRLSALVSTRCSTAGQVGDLWRTRGADLGREPSDRPGPGPGCVALATLEGSSWQVHPPLLSPGAYAMMECPQLTRAGGLLYLTFVTLRGWVSRGSGIAARTGLHAWVAPNLHGPWRPVNGDAWIPGQEPGTYGTRILAWEGGFVAIPWVMHRNGRFLGAIGRPRSVTFEGDHVEIHPPS